MFFHLFGRNLCDGVEVVWGINDFLDYGIHILGFSRTIASGLYPGSLADFQSAKEPTGFEPVVVEW